jgi:hypothetical protein
MSKNSSMARYKQLKEWLFMFNRNRKYKPKKKKIINPASMYYINNEGKVIFVDEEE